MHITKVEIFDPPMCCSTGACGSSPAKAMLQLAQRYLEGDPSGVPVVQSCCG